MLRHDWPLNVRQLEMALRAAGELAGWGKLDLVHLPEAVRAALVEASGDEDAPSAVRPLDDADRELRDRLEQLLQQHGGNVSEVARQLGKARAQIHRWIRFGLDAGGHRRR